MTFDVQASEREAGVVVLSPSGAIDATTAGALEQRVDSFLRAAPRLLVLDMAGVTYISSAGLRVVLKAKKNLSRAGGTVLLVGLQPAVKRIFEIINAFSADRFLGGMEELDVFLKGKGGA